MKKAVNFLLMFLLIFMTQVDASAMSYQDSWKEYNKEITTVTAKYTDKYLINIHWDEVEGAVGYQIQISREWNFKTHTDFNLGDQCMVGANRQNTKEYINFNETKVYYVRVRIERADHSYGPWSMTTVARPMNGNALSYEFNGSGV